MRVEIQTYLGNVVFESDKVEGNLEKALPLQRFKLLSKFFPIEWNQIDVILFFPKNEKCDTEECRGELLSYLRTEGFIGEDGNFMVGCGKQLELV